MGLTIIIRSKLKSHGRSDDHKLLKDEGWGGAGLTDEQADRADFIERMLYKQGITKPTSLRQHQIDQVK